MSHDRTPCARIAQREPIVFCRIFTLLAFTNRLHFWISPYGVPPHFARGKSCATNSQFIRHIVRRAPCGKRPFYEQARSIVARVACASIECESLRPSGCVLAFRCNERKLLMSDYYSNGGAPMPPRRGSHAKPQDSGSRVPESVRSFITQQSSEPNSQNRGYSPQSTTPFSRQQNQHRASQKSKYLARCVRDRCPMLPN